MMSQRREYEIAFVGLKAGIHEFNCKLPISSLMTSNSKISGTAMPVKLPLTKMASC
jgi:hypothetical protein